MPKRNAQAHVGAGRSLNETICLTPQQRRTGAPQTRQIHSITSSARNRKRVGRMLEARPNQRAVNGHARHSACRNRLLVTSATILVSFPFSSTSLNLLLQIIGEILRRAATFDQMADPADRPRVLDILTAFVLICYRG